MPSARAQRLRVISGSAGGRLLQLPRRHELRPTQDRIRQVVFSSLGEKVIDARVLDLFAGVGTYGLEALSRGARSASFVEINAESAACIQANLAGCRLKGEVVTSSVIKYLSQASTGSFDLVFGDPPYQKTRDRLTFDGILPHLEKVIKKDGLLVWEYYSGQEVEEEPNWELVRRRSYGETGLVFLRLKV